MAGREGIEPTAELRQMAAFFWQMFVALRSEGFSEQQALTIIGFSIQSGQGSSDGG